MSKPIVIAFLGEMHSGKSTAAKYVASEYKAKLFSFATPLKHILKELLDLSDIQLYGTQEQKGTIDERYGVSPRVLSQKLGKSLRDHTFQNIWAQVCIDGILNHYYNNANRFYVIDDCRYPSEAEYLKNSKYLETYIIKLMNTDKKPSLYSGHESELGVNLVSDTLIDYKITSKETPQSVDLISQIDNVVFTNIILPHL